MPLGTNKKEFFPFVGMKCTGDKISIVWYIIPLMYQYTLVELFNNFDYLENESKVQLTTKAEQLN